jgi:hypothetical protein
VGETVDQVPHRLMARGRSHRRYGIVTRLKLRKKHTSPAAGLAATSPYSVVVSLLAASTVLPGMRSPPCAQGGRTVRGGERRAAGDAVRGAVQGGGGRGEPEGERVRGRDGTASRSRKWASCSSSSRRRPSG